MQLEEDVCPKLVAFGEEPQAAIASSGEGDVQIMMAKALPFLQKLLHLLDRLCSVLENLLLQLGSLCAEHTRKATILQGKFLLIKACNSCVETSMLRQKQVGTLMLSEIATCSLVCGLIDRGYEIKALAATLDLYDKSVQVILQI